MLLAPKIIPNYYSSKEFGGERTIKASHMISHEKSEVKDHDNQTSDEEEGEVKKETTSPTTEEGATDSLFNIGDKNQQDEFKNNLEVFNPEEIRTNNLLVDEE